MDGQNWEPTVLRKAGTGGGAAGGGGGGGASASATGIKLARLDEDTTTFKHASVPLELARAIQAGRAAKGWKQAELAAAVQLPPAVVTAYESGKGTPNNEVIAKLERALGVKLPRVPKVKK